MTRDMSDEAPTEAEVTEAIRRAVVASEEPHSDQASTEVISHAIADLVACGQAEWVSGSGGDSIYRLTEEGDRAAAALVKQILERVPPRQDAVLHVMELFAQDFPDIDRAPLLEFCEYVLRVEHFRLGERIESLCAEELDPSEDARALVTVRILAAALRQGTL